MLLKILHFVDLYPIMVVIRYSIIIYICLEPAVLSIGCLSGRQIHTYMKAQRRRSQKQEKTLGTGLIGKYIHRYCRDK